MEASLYTNTNTVRTYHYEAFSHPRIGSTYQCHPSITSRRESFTLPSGQLNLATVVYRMCLTLSQARDVKCDPPGPQRCAIIVWVRISSNGLDLGTNTGRGLEVVGGTCDSIKADGKLVPGGGWSADITTTYGPHLYFGAYNLGIRTIAGVTYQYNGKSYEQKHCKTFQENDGWRIVDVPGLFGTSGVDAIQCDFDC